MEGSLKKELCKKHCILHSMLNFLTLPILEKWEQPYIDRLLWNAKAFGRQVVQRYFTDWHALAEENQRLWDAYYRLRPASAPWEGWQQWIVEYRTLVATAQEVCELQ